MNLAKEKTNIISFSMLRQEGNIKFEFLGFEFRWGMSKKGKYIIILKPRIVEDGYCQIGFDINFF